MPKTILIPNGKFHIDDDVAARADLFVEAITQIFKFGTVGATVPEDNAPATLYPDGANPEYDPLTGLPKLKPLVVDTGEKQLYYRQLAMALAVLGTGGGGGGISKPGLVWTGEWSAATTYQPNDAVSWNGSSYVSTTVNTNQQPAPLDSPTPNPGWDLLAKKGDTWTQPITPTTSQAHLFSAECPSMAVPGDLVYPVANWHTTVDFADPNDYAKLPAVGVIQSKSDPITCVVQTHGVLAGVYSGLLPGKTYFVGTGRRPVDTPPVAPVNGAIFHQPVGVAIDPVTMLLSPSVNLTRTRG